MIGGNFLFLLPEFLTPMITETNCCSENGIATVAVKLSVCCALYNVVYEKGHSRVVDCIFSLQKVSLYCMSGWFCVYS